MPVGTPDDVISCPEGDIDPRWGIEWAAAQAGRRGTQPCPAFDDADTVGFAFRVCGQDGEWEEEVDVTVCRNLMFSMLESQANDVFESLDGLSESMRMTALTGLTGILVNATAPRDGGLFPLDLDTALRLSSATLDTLLANNQMELEEVSL